MNRKGKCIALAFSGMVLSVSAGVQSIPDFTWENSSSDKYLVEHVKLEGLKPGMRAELEMWVDAHALSNGYPEASLAWDNIYGKTWAGSSGGTVLRWKNPRIEKDAAGRRKFIIRTKTFPYDSTGFKLYFFAQCPAVGKIRYTDIKMKTYDRTYDMKMASSAYRDEAHDGDVRFVASFITDPESEPLDRLEAVFSYTAKNGKTVRLPAGSLAHDSAECTIPVSSLAFGAQEVRFELSMKNGQRLDGVALPFTRLSEPSRRKVRFDSFGRLIVDGKPFFPLGMYWSENTLAKPRAIERYVAPGVFNTLQTYEKSMTREMLDLFHTNGLKAVVSVKDIYIPEPDGTKFTFVPDSVKTKEDETRYVTEIVNRCKDHPALLVWYTSDEMKARYADRLEDRYRLLKKLDPDHPVFVLAFTDAIRGFLGALDVGGTDPYPICSIWKIHEKYYNARPDEGCVWEAGRIATEEWDAMFRLKPLWQVPQAFMWAWDHGGEDKRPELRFPTRNELSSMTWQQIAAGANGILFYSYGQLHNRCRNEGEFHKYFSEITVPVAREVKDMAKVLLMEPGPAIANVPRKTMVRTWRDGDGSVYVLVCNTHPEFRDGEIEIPGKWAKCEPVFGRRLSFRNGKLETKMAPMGVSIVKLTAK